MAGKTLVSIKSLHKNLMASVEDTTARIKSNAGNTIGIRNSKFTFKQEVIGRSMAAIAVDFIHAQTWYDTPFDADNPHPPACHALSASGDDMQPLPKSPHKVSEFCDGCEKNAWGSADIGRGKACSQQIKIAVIAVGPGETLENCEMAVMTLPPTSLKNWNTYVKKLAKDKQLPPFAFVTRFSFDEEAEHPVLTFEIEKEITSVSDLVAICGEDGKGGRVKEARELLLTPPDFSEQAPKKKVGKKAARKKVAKEAPAKKASKKKASTKKAATKKRGASKFS